MKATTAAKAFLVAAITWSAVSSSTILDNGAYTTVSGTDWLDLSITDGLSVAAALAENGGWELATRSEFIDMFNEFEDPLDSLFFDEETETQRRYNIGFTEHKLSQPRTLSNRFSELFGITRNNAVTRHTLGWYNDSGRQLLGGVVENADIAFTYDMLNVPYSDGSVFSFTHENIGTFLVRSATQISVPAPSIRLNFIIGLVLLIGGSCLNKHYRNRYTQPLTDTNAASA